MLHKQRLHRKRLQTGGGCTNRGCTNRGYPTQIEATLHKQGLYTEGESHTQRLHT